MAKSFHENELLELVEGTLDSARANAMRAKLASEPSLVHLVEGMTADREALRSVPEPTLPMDFVNELGPRLARPMLMEPVHAMKPGEFRRQQRRVVRLRMWKRAAVAAGIVLVTGASVVVLVKEMQRGGGSAELADGGSGTQGNMAPGGMNGSADALALGNVQDADAVVEHSLPRAGLGVSVAQRDSQGEQIVHEGAPAVLVAGRFALVVQKIDESALRENLRAFVMKGAGAMALVGNFSFDEARSIEERLAQEAGRARRNGGNEAVADVNGGEHSRKNEVNTKLSDGERTRMIAAMSAAAKEEMKKRSSNGKSGLVAGAAKLSPSLEQQLEFSSEGASFTLTMDAHTLADALENVADQLGTMVSLRVIRGEEEAGRLTGAASNPLVEWLNDLPAIRDEMKRLEAMPAGSSVMVPVVLEK